jgi:hypothetical protein
VVYYHAGRIWGQLLEEGLGETASGVTCNFYGCRQKLGEGPSALCQEHQYKEWYTVAEAASIWSASERSVRDWITRRGIVGAERSGRRPYLIPAIEFTKPHPTQRPRPMAPSPMVTVLPVSWHRRFIRPLVAALTLLLVLAATGGSLALTGHLGPPALRGDTSGGQPPGIFVGDTPLSVRFDSWSPGEPVLVMVGQGVELSVTFTNTSPVTGDFYAAVSLKDPEGRWVNLRPLRKVRLEPGAQGSASWRYAPGLIGSWDLVFGAWGHWEEGQEPKEPVGSTGILEGRIMAFQQCIENPNATGLISIGSYTPFQPVHLPTGADVELAITFTSTGDTPQTFSAGATVWRAGSLDTLDGDYRSTTVQPLQPGETATLGWRHHLDSEGSHQLMFTLWDAEDRVLVKAPCPRQRLVVVSPPLSPTVTGVEPEQPRSQPTRQWISIRGANFAETSAVVLSIQGNRYPIPEDRTEYVSPGKLRVLVGLTDPGTWTAQVVIAGELESNLFGFRVLP